MKRLKLSVLMLLSVFLLSACGEQADIRSAADLSAPEEAADLMMESLKGLNLDLFNEYTDNYVGSERNWLGITVRKEYQVFNELLPFTGTESDTGSTDSSPRSLWRTFPGR